MGKEQGTVKPRFSVIVPAYNAEEHMRPGMDSIASQTFRDYELIVVCDKCLDRTEQIAREEYGAKTAIVDYGHDGLSRNKGISMATGEWLLFMDDDDWFLHECVFEMLDSVIGRNDEDVMMFSYICKGLGYIRQSNDGITSQCWCKCWRRKFITDNGIRFSLRPNWSDTDFTRRAMQKVRKAMYWDVPLYYYNFMREGSVTEKAIRGQIKGAFT